MNRVIGKAAIEQRENEMFGVTTKYLDALAKEAIALFEGSMFPGVQMLAMGILSDAQEWMAHEKPEIARVFINRAKYLMSKYWKA